MCIVEDIAVGILAGASHTHLIVVILSLQSSIRVSSTSIVRVGCDIQRRVPTIGRGDDVDARVGIQGYIFHARGTGGVPCILSWGPRNPWGFGSVSRSGSHGSIVRDVGDEDINLESGTVDEGDASPPDQGAP
jgi:hypothetical protein